MIAPLLPAAKHGGRPRTVDLREVVNTIVYQNRTGCQWDLLPHDLQPRSTAHDYFAAWRDDGTWQQILDALRQAVRVADGRDPSPSAGSIDSQSVKTTPLGGERGFDAGKKVSGRKRHIVVDTLGLLLAVAVTAANVDDAAAAPRVLEQLTPERHPRLQLLWADQKYHNYKLYHWLSDRKTNYELDIVQRPVGAKGFQLVHHRWVAERSIAWLNRSRRLSKDYERRTDSSQAMIKVSAIHLMLRRLKPNTQLHYAPFYYSKENKAKLGG